MEYVVYGIVGIVCGLVLKAWVKHAYHSGMKAGIKIADGVEREEELEYLFRTYDKYYKEGD